jgi:hypothetical protein
LNFLKFLKLLKPLDWGMGMLIDGEWTLKIDLENGFGK